MRLPAQHLLGQGVVVVGPGQQVVQIELPQLRQGFAADLGQGAGVEPVAGIDRDMRVPIAVLAHPAPDDVALVRGVAFFQVWKTQHGAPCRQMFKRRLSFTDVPDELRSADPGTVETAVL